MLIKNAREYVNKNSISEQRYFKIQGSRFLKPKITHPAPNHTRKGNKQDK